MNSSIIIADHRIRQFVTGERPGLPTLPTGERIYGINMRSGKIDVTIDSEGRLKSHDRPWIVTVCLGSLMRGVELFKPLEPQLAHGAHNSASVLVSLAYIAGFESLLRTGVRASGMMPYGVRSALKAVETEIKDPFIKWEIQNTNLSLKGQEWFASVPRAKLVTRAPEFRQPCLANN